MVYSCIWTHYSHIQTAIDQFVFNYPLVQNTPRTAFSLQDVQLEPKIGTYELTHSTRMFFHMFLVWIICRMQELCGVWCNSASSADTHTHNLVKC